MAPAASKHQSRLFGSSWAKECQRTVAIVCWDAINGMDSMSQTEQQRQLYNKYHGEANNNDSISFVKLFVAGEQTFKHVYDQESVVVTNRDATTNQCLKMKKSIVGDHVFVAGKDFDAIMLAKAKLSNQTLISGRTLQSQAMLVHRNVKKAIAYGREFCLAEVIMLTNENPTSSMSETELFRKMLMLPSGSSREDLLKYVLDKMYAELKPEEVDEADDTNSDANANTDVNVQTQQQYVTAPEDYFFPGWIAFCVFTCFAENPDNELSIFQQGDLSAGNARGGSRAAARKHQQEEQNQQRSVEAASGSSPSSVFQRGINLTQHLQVASLAQRETSQEQRDREAELMICMQQKTQKMREIDQAMQLAKIFGGNNADSVHWKKVFALQQQSTDLDKEIDNLKKRKREPNVVVSGLLQAVTKKEKTTKAAVATPSSTASSLSSQSARPAPGSNGTNRTSSTLSSVEQGGVRLEQRTQQKQKSTRATRPAQPATASQKRRESLILESGSTSSSDDDNEKES